MVDDQFDMNVGTGLPLPPPRFDDSATARAQPVEPISQSRFSNWFGRGGSVRELITTKSSALALVVIAGLATGTLGGMALVSYSQQSVPIDQTTANEPAITIANSQLDFETAEIGASGLLVTGATVSRRKIPARERRGGAQRAYRVAVIH